MGKNKPGTRGDAKIYTDGTLTDEARKLLASLSRPLSEPPDEMEYNGGVMPDEYYDYLENRYEEQDRKGIFNKNDFMDIDEEHSDASVIGALNYMYSVNGFVTEQDAPTDFLNSHEKKAVFKNGKFRPKLYKMLLTDVLWYSLHNRTVYTKTGINYKWNPHLDKEANRQIIYKPVSTVRMWSASVINQFALNKTKDEIMLSLDLADHIGRLERLLKKSTAEEIADFVDIYPGFCKFLRLFGHMSDQCKAC